MKGIIMICTFCVAVMHALTAQELQIRGRITDLQGMPLEHVIIKISNRQTYDETDSDGRFLLQARAGDRAEVVHMNFKTLSVVLEDGMEIVLEESVIELDNILVKADPFRDVPQSVVIQDRVKMASQPRNVSDLFKDIPGFGILKRGNYASEPVFRSFKYEQLNVQYDGGMKILNACPNRMDPITTHVIPEEIERIEIVKGPFTVRFGQNFGGIINMVSRSTSSAEPGWSGNLETGYETNGGNFSSRASLVRKWERIDVEANASYRDYGDYTDGNGNEVPSSFRTTDYSIKFGLSPAEGQRLRLTWRQSFARDVKHAGLPMDSPYDDSYLVGLDYRYLELGEKLPSLMVKAFYSHVDHLMTNEGRPNYMMTGAESNVFVSTFGAKAELEIRPSQNLLLFAGMDANLIGREGDRIRTIKMMNGMPLPSPVVKVDKIWQDSRMNILGLFTEAKYLFSDRTKLTAGIRTDFVSSEINDPEQDFLDLYGGVIEGQEEVNLSGNVSVMHSLDRLRLQMALGRGVRTASLMERYINHFNVGPDPYEYVGNPYLDPELNYQAEFSLQYKADRLQLEGSLFYSLLKDYITAVVDPDLPRKYMPMQEPRYAKRFVNVEDAMQSGFEFSLTYDLGRGFGITGDLSYTYGQNKTLDEPLPQVPPLTGHVGAHFTKEKFWAYANTRLVAEQSRISESFGEETTPGFATLDLSGGFVPWRGVQIGLSVLNVFDTAYYEHLNYSFTNSDLNQGRIYEPGRNFTAYVRYDF